MSDNDDDDNSLSIKLGVLHADVGEIKTALGKLSDAIIKLALVEERQTATTAAIERAFKSIEAIANRVAALERSSDNSSRTSSWVDRLVTAAAGVVIILVLKKTGIL